MKKLLFCAAALVLGSLSAADTIRGQSLPMNFALQVTGIVRYADNREPVDHALVTIESFGGGLVGQVSTDRTGKFSFTRLSPVQYVVTVHMPGFNDEREDVNLATNVSSYLNIQLRRDPTSISRPRTDYSIIPLTTLSANVPLAAQEEFEKGRALTASGNKNGVGDAIKHFEKALVLFPGYVEAQLMLGLAYTDLQQLDKAEKALLDAINLNNGASTAYFALGDIYRSQKKYNESEKALLDGLKATPDSAIGHLSLAKLYWEWAPSAPSAEAFRDKLERSWKETEVALKLKEDEAEAHLLAGNLLLKARRAPDALKHFERYLVLEPKGAFATEASNMVQKIKQAMAQSSKKN